MRIYNNVFIKTLNTGLKEYLLIMKPTCKFNLTVHLLIYLCSWDSLYMAKNFGMYAEWITLRLNDIDWPHIALISSQQVYYVTTRYSPNGDAGNWRLVEIGVMHGRLRKDCRSFAVRISLRHLAQNYMAQDGWNKELRVGSRNTVENTE